MALHYHKTKNQPTLLFLATFRVVRHLEICCKAYFILRGNTFFMSKFDGQVLLLSMRGIQCHCYIHLGIWTQRPVHPIEFQVLRLVLVFQIQQNCNSGCNKTSTFIDKVPCTLHPSIGLLIYTSTNAKEEQICQLHEKPIFYYITVSGYMRALTICLAVFQIFIQNILLKGIIPSNIFIPEYASNQYHKHGFSCCSNYPQHGLIFGS